MAISLLRISRLFLMPSKKSVLQLLWILKYRTASKKVSKETNSRKIGRVKATTSAFFYIFCACAELIFSYVFDLKRCLCKFSNGRMKVFRFIEGFDLIYDKILKYYEKFKNSKEVQLYPKCRKSYQNSFIYGWSFGKPV